MPTLQLAPETTLHYEDDDCTDPWRTPPVMLLQHGFSRSARFWYTWVPILGREFRILRPDMRGMGRSTIPEAHYKPALDTFAADVHRLLDHLGVERVVFVGEEPLTSPLEQQFMASQLPHCELAVYPKLGHGVSVLQPAWCVERIRAFLGLIVENYPDLMSIRSQPGALA